MNVCAMLEIKQASREKVQDVFQIVRYHHILPLDANLDFDEMFDKQGWVSVCYVVIG